MKLLVPRSLVLNSVFYSTAVALPSWDKRDKRDSYLSEGHKCK